MVCHNNISLKFHERQLEHVLNVAAIRIATIALDIYRESSLVSLWNNKESLRDLRVRLDVKVAEVLALILVLAREHGVDATSRLSKTELTILEQALYSHPEAEAKR